VYNSGIIPGILEAGQPAIKNSSSGSRSRSGAGSRSDGGGGLCKPKSGRVMRFTAEKNKKGWH
jgi:hypothetical protein